MTSRVTSNQKLGADSGKRVMQAKFLEVTDETPSRSLTIDDMCVGDTVFQRFVFDTEALASFGHLAKDRAPIHANPSFAKQAGFKAPIVQGLALTTRFSRLIGMYLPGEKAILEKVELKFKEPVYSDRELEYRCSVVRLLKPMRVVQLAVAIAVNGNDHVVGQCQCLVRQ